jgi:hypothetical protein
LKLHFGNGIRVCDKVGQGRETSRRCICRRRAIQRQWFGTKVTGALSFCTAHLIIWMQILKVAERASYFAVLCEDLGLVWKLDAGFGWRESAVAAWV